MLPRHLRIFLALAQSIKFSRIAEQFDVTQPALRKLVKDLEQALGVVLFERSTRSMQLTVEGAKLLPVVGQLVEQYDGNLVVMQRFGDP